MRNIIVREYLETLNESGELDLIFPLLLESMGFRIVSTPKNSKGQSQYGKDVIAIGKDVNGVKHRYYFELKGYIAKDIDDRSFLVKDGIRDSILAAKYTAYKDNSIPQFNDLPIKIVFVHNGILKENTRETFNGFIAEEFRDNNFERWDIDALTRYFTDYLFGEGLFSDDESYRLFKKTLVLLDVRSSEFSDLENLIDIQFAKYPSSKPQNLRVIKNLFARIRLITAVIYSFSKSQHNMHPAKICSDIAVLKSWSWILKNKQESNKSVLELFNNLVWLQMQVYSVYFNNTLSIAIQEKGLYDITNNSGEQVLYPLRCFDYAADLIYYYHLIDLYVVDKTAKQDVIRDNISNLRNLIEHNSGFDSILVDNQSISLLLIFHYVLTKKENDSQAAFLGEYLLKIVTNLIIRYRKLNMLPETYGNKLALAKSIYTKHDDYQDSSSLVILLLCELCSFFGANEMYSQLRDIVNESKVNLQVAYPIEDIDIEQLLFEKRLYDELCVETSIKLPETVDEFERTFKKRYNRIHYRTDQTGFGLIRLLAHKYYCTDLFPDFLNLGYLYPLTEESQK